MLSQSILISWVGFFIGLVGIFLFPLLDRSLNPISSAPGIITFLGVSLSLITGMSLIIWGVLQSQMGQAKQFLFFALITNIFIILTKFVFAPLAVYGINVSKDIPIPLDQPLTVILIAVILFLLYSLVVFLMYKGYMNHVESLLLQKKINKKMLLKGFSAVFVVVLLIGIFGFLTGGILFEALIIPLFFGLQVLTYIQIVLSSLYSLIISVSLVAAVIFLNLTFKTAAEQAIILRKAAILSSLFALTIGLLLFYHVLWAVFFLTIVSIWPLRIVVPK